MSYAELGKVLVLIIAIYFLFKLGTALADNYFDDGFSPWLGAILLLLFGWSKLADKTPSLLGLLGFVPILTYIFLSILRSIGSESSVRKKAQGIALSSGASVTIYAITHTVFGFGVTEASISAFLSAGILGIVGYTA